MDYDYLDKLSEAELSWLNKFTEEYNNASFKHDGTDIQSYEKYGKDSNDRNNARNRCLYGHLKNKADKFNNTKLLNYDNLIGDIEDYLIKEVDPSTLEDSYIDYMDSEHMREMLEEYDIAMERFSEISE